MFQIKVIVLYGLYTLKLLYKFFILCVVFETFDKVQFEVHVK